MKINVINWIISKIESGEIEENQIVVVYDKNNNVKYLGKAEFAPLSLFDEFKTATIVDNELRINERQPERATRGESEYKMINHENFLHMYPDMNLYGYIDTDIIARRKAMLNTIYGNVTKPSTSFCNAPHRISGSIVNQLNIWCAYCRWRHNPKTYYIARERVNVELSEYAAYNPYC